MHSPVPFALLTLLLNDKTTSYDSLFDVAQAETLIDDFCLY